MGEYHTNKEIRAKIDEVLHTNVMLFQNLGVSSTKQERHEASVQERKNLREIADLDREFINFLLSEK